MKIYKFDETQYTPEEVSLLANRKGYQTEIFNKETGEMIPNPESEMDFIERKFKDYADDFFASVLVQELDEQIQQQKTDGIEQIKARISATSVIEEL